MAPDLTHWSYSLECHSYDRCYSNPTLLAWRHEKIQAINCVILFTALTIRGYQRFTTQKHFMGESQCVSATNIAVITLAVESNKHTSPCLCSGIRAEDVRPDKHVDFGAPGGLYSFRNGIRATLQPCRKIYPTV